MNSSSTTRPCRSHPLHVTAVALLLLALIAPARAGTGNRAPDLGDCPDLQVPDGHKVSFHAYAAGVQIWRWNGASWTFAGPEAVLYSDAQGQDVVGIHYAGPTWESNSGSKVRATLLHPCPVDPGSIAWLKLGAVSTEGPGIFRGVTFTQRVNTVGGIAPTNAGDFVGQEARVPYTAEYFFYRAQH